MPYLIFRPGRSERERAIQSRTTGSDVGRVRGTARTIEEAVELQRQHEREGEDFTLPYAANDGPEAKAAFIDQRLREGRDPETGQRLHSESTKHE